MENVVRYGLDEIATIRIRCKECKSDIAFSLDAKPATMLASLIDSPKGCMGCGTPLLSRLGKENKEFLVLKGLLELLQDARAEEHNLRGAVTLEFKPHRPG